MLSSIRPHSLSGPIHARLAPITRSAPQASCDRETKARSRLPDKVIQVMPSSIHSANPALARPRAQKQPQDTATWCRARAAADLALAGDIRVDNGRLRLEHSAASWADRADLLERLEASYQARVAKPADTGPAESRRPAD